MSPSSFDEVLAASDQWTDAALECRALRAHAWTQVHSVRNTRYRFWLVHWRCARGCGVRKTTELNDRGQYLRSQLDYSEAEGYLFSGGRIGGDGMGALRIAMLSRRQYEKSRAKPKVRRPRRRAATG